jgi:predicted outer membrane repeat protein
MNLITMENCTNAVNIVAAGPHQITNCQFTNNGNTIVTGYSVDITNCSFTHNHGSLSLADRFPTTVTGCTFANNTAVSISTSSYATLVMTNSSFFGNTGSEGVAIYAANSTLNLVNVYAHDNTATIHGGVVFLEFCNASFSQVQFIDNVASTYGGAIYVSGSNMSLIDSVLQGNMAQTGGAVYSAYNSIFYTSNCTVSFCTYFSRFFYFPFLFPLVYILKGID